MRRAVVFLDRGVRAVLDVAAWLALPVVLLLFLQWPLRDGLKAYSREANDLGQIFFALYVALAVTAATRAHVHLAADLVSRRYSPGVRAVLFRAGSLLCLLPWSLFVLVFSWRMARPAVMSLETFPDTFNPGYFIIKLAVLLLALLMLLQAAIDVLGPNAGNRAS